MLIKKWLVIVQMQNDPTSNVLLEFVLSRLFASVHEIKIPAASEYQLLLLPMINACNFSNY